MKLNNKGFAISSIMYLILILALILVSLTISLIMSRKLIIDKQKNEVLNYFNGNLSLSKETCIFADFNEWTLTNGTLTDGVLTLGENGSYADALSPYYNVNGGFWYPIFDGYSDNTIGRIHWQSYYYDINQNSTNTLNGYSQNGWAENIGYQTWKNNIIWNNTYNNIIDGYKVKNRRFGTNIKYIKLEYSTTTTLYHNLAPIKVRNLRICGDKIPNDYYNINVKLKNNKTIQTIKYDYGRKNKSYFSNNGIVSSDNPIVVTENGIYTVYVKDTEGNEYISIIKITDIIE